MSHFALDKLVMNLNQSLAQVFAENFLLKTISNLWSKTSKAGIQMGMASLTTTKKRRERMHVYKNFNPFLLCKMHLPLSLSPSSHKTIKFKTFSTIFHSTNQIFTKLFCILKLKLLVQDEHWESARIVLICECSDGRDGTNMLNQYTTKTEFPDFLARQLIDVQKYLQHFLHVIFTLFSGNWKAKLRFELE